MMSIPTVIWSVSIIIASLFTIVGNLFVIAAILVNRTLRTSKRNYLILSLAVTDLIYGFVYMPVKGLTNPTKIGNWFYGAFLCQAYYILSYTSAFASILNLVMIALDRYLSISNLLYVLETRGIIIRIMIAIVWCVSFACSCFMVYTDPDFFARIHSHQQCMYSLSHLTLISLIIGYYIPLVMIIVVYMLIYKTAKDLLLNRRNLSVSEQRISISDQPIDRFGHEIINCAENGDEARKESVFTVTEATHIKEINDKRERHLSAVLTLITCVFIICWTPTMITVTINIMCVHCRNWSLYTDYYFIFSSTSAFNSALNPVLYTLFLNEFRATFKLLLKKYLCRCFYF